MYTWGLLPPHARNKKLGETVMTHQEMPKPNVS